jgi:hypothetical protein
VLTQLGNGRPVSTLINGTQWEICAFKSVNESSVDVKEAMRKCSGKKQYLHCNIGGVRFGLPCGGSGSPPLSERQHLLQSFSPNLDDPKYKVLTQLFQTLHLLNGSLFLFGDSQMTNFQLGINCDLIREGVHPYNYDALTKVHVNGGEVIVDRCNGGQIEFDSVETTIAKLLKLSDYVLVVLNTGTHHNSRVNYDNVINALFPKLNDLALLHKSSVDIVWMETPPQHFNSTNGYWEGRHSKCEPIANTSVELDWRNYDVDMMMARKKITTIKILRVRDIMIDLWREHHRGDMVDCTHYCYWPMLYRPMYRQLLDILNARKRHNKL